METENALTIAKENSTEFFYEEEARLWAEVLGNQIDPPDLEFLQHRLENIDHLMRTLELPWNRFIPILYRSFALYMCHPEETTGNRKAYQLSVQLMDAIVYLSQHTSLIHQIHQFCIIQLADLKQIKEERAAKAKESTSEDEQESEIEEGTKTGISDGTEISTKTENALESVGDTE